MTPFQRSDQSLALLECTICAAEPVVVTAQYVPANKRRIHKYALCADCFAETQDEHAQQAALAAIERYFERLTEANRPPWERRP